MFSIIELRRMNEEIFLLANAPNLVSEIRNRVKAEFCGGVLARLSLLTELWYKIIQTLVGVGWNRVTLNFPQ